MTYTRYYNGLDMNVQISTLLYQAENQYCKLLKKKRTYVKLLVKCTCMILLLLVDYVSYIVMCLYIL